MIGVCVVTYKCGCNLYAVYETVPWNENELHVAKTCLNIVGVLPILLLV